MVFDLINSQKLLRRVLPIFTMWFLFLDDLGHTPSVTTQNTRYIDYHYWPDHVDQSSEVECTLLINYSLIGS